MNKDQRSDVKVVCKINPNILKELGLDAQIKSALAKVTKPKKHPQTLATVCPPKPEELVSPKKKIQVIKQETVDSSLATEILQTLPRSEALAKIIEGRLKSVPESQESQELPQDEQFVFQEILSGQEEYLGDVEFEEEAEYIVADTTEYSQELPDNFYQTGHQEPPDLIEETQESEEVAEELPNVFEEEVVVEELIQEEEIPTPGEAVEVIQDILLETDAMEVEESQEKIENSESEESFMGFSSSAEVPEQLPDPKSHKPRFRSLSDTIVTVRSRLSIHREVQELVKTSSRFPDTSEDSSGSSESSEEESGDTEDETSDIPLDSHERDELIKNFLALKRNSLDGMMQESFEESEESDEDPEAPQSSQAEIEDQIPEEEERETEERETVQDPDPPEVPVGSPREDPEPTETHQETPAIGTFIITEIDEVEPPVVVKPERSAVAEIVSETVPEAPEPMEPDIPLDIPEEPPSRETIRIKVEKDVQETPAEEPNQTEEPREPEEPRRSTRSRTRPKTEEIYDVPMENRRKSRRSKAPESLEAPRSHEADAPSPLVMESPTGDKRKTEETPKQEPKRTKVSNPVICGRCKTSVPSSTWHKHLIVHNGVAWKEDIEPPLDFESETVRAKVIQTFIRKHRLSQVKCEKCGDIRKSGVGLVSHERTCGMSREDIQESMVTCEYCSRRVLPCSLRTHQTNHCSKLKKLQEVRVSPEKPSPKADPEAEFSTSGRLKRKSQRVAEAKFRRDLSPDDSDPFARSDTDASFGAESSESEGTSGVTETSEVFPSDDEEGSRRRSSKKRKRSRKKKHRSDSRISIVNDANKKAFSGRSWSQWRSMTKQQLLSYYKTNIDVFRQKNYSNEALFPEWMPKDSPATDNEDFRDYLPKSSASIYFDQHRVNHYKVSFGGASSETLSTLECFEGVCEANNPAIFYCGAPILSLDWLPNPQEATQGHVLAVSCASSFRINYEYSHNEAEKTIIQIWRVDQATQSVSFLYGLAYDWGPVFCVKFCPSGGFSSCGDRLGLLAVSSCNGNIAIFALPAPPQRRILRLSPCVVLESRQESLVTRVAWSEMDGHAYVAGGLASGKVLVWKLDVESRLLRRRRNNEEILYPNLTIHAHIYPVTVVMFPRLEERNLLFTASVDKSVKIFDLSCGREISTLNYRSQITCAAWPLNWPVYIFGIDNSYQWSRTEVQLKQPFNIPYDDATLILHTQDITDLSLNDWTNVLIVATESGDVCGNFRQYYSPLSKKADLMRRIVSYTDSIELAGRSGVTNDEESLSYVIENCGILFCDLQKEVDLKATKAYRTRHIADYPLTRINKITFNPNESSHSCYAIGYQAGFVRISKL